MGSHVGYPYSSLLNTPYNTWGRRAYTAWPYTRAIHHLGKRDAEPEPEANPEADPALFYSGLSHVGYPYSSLLNTPYNTWGRQAYITSPYNTWGSRAYTAWPYTRAIHHLGKRDAEPEPEADPALFYSGLSHVGYPYSS